MNAEGYRQYLAAREALDELALREIARLEALEKELSLELDDFIPYADVSPVLALHDAMPEELTCDEALGFAINRYMVYKLEESGGMDDFLALFDDPCND